MIFKILFISKINIIPFFYLKIEIICLYLYLISSILSILTCYIFINFYYISLKFAEINFLIFQNLFCFNVKFFKKFSI